MVGEMGGLVVTVVFQKEEGRCRLDVINLGDDATVPAEEVLAALVSAADELKFRMRLAREQRAPQPGERPLASAPGEKGGEAAGP